MLEVEDLSVAYRGRIALDHVTLNVRPGEMVAVLGANGAGKSTLLRAVSGLADAHTGDVRHRGETITSMRPHRIVRRGVAHVPSGRRLFVDQTVEANLLIGAHGRPRSAARHSLDGVYERLPVLQQRRDDLAGSLSGGQQQLVAVARGLMSEPDVLLLDEPSFGLAPTLAERIIADLAVIASAGTAVLLVEQAAELALEFSSRAYVLQNGRIALQGVAGELSGHPEFTAAYMGLATTQEPPAPPHRLTATNHP